MNGTVLDSTGAAVAHARVMLTRPDQSPNQETLAADDGQFSFANVPPGPFQITVTAEGFSTMVSSGELHPGEYCVVPQIVLAVATEITEVRVTPLSPVELAEEQIEDEEKQRVFGVLPNFYVTYVPDAVPLSSKQKFKLAWRASVDPGHLCNYRRRCGTAAGEQRFQRIRAGRGGLRPALRRGLRRRGR